MQYGSHTAAAGLSSLEGRAAPADNRSALTFPSLILLNLMTGLGNSGAFTAAMNAQARSWGGDRRGSATALVLSGFGLSAFFYSSLSHTLFPGNTEDYLRLLALGSAASFLIGLLVVKIYPPGGYSSLPTEEETDAEQEEDEERIADEEGRPRPESRRSSVTYSRRRTSSELSALAYARSGDLAPEDEPTGRPSDVEGGVRNGAGAGPNGGKALSPIKQGPQEDVTGLALLKRVDFIILFSIMACVSGAGLLLINNVGTITRTLWRYNHRDDKDAAQLLVVRELVDAARKGKKGDDTAAAIQQLQAHQVSVISIGNAAGRIIIGLAADFVVNRTRDARTRVWLLLPVCMLAIFSQSLAAAPNTITSVHQLLLVSASTGLMYGTLFGICPSLVLEFFGLASFSQNWGWTSLSPVVAGNLFNLLFGRIYDSHVPAGSTTHECYEGEECYRSVFVVTTWCALLATLCSLALIFRRAGVPKALRPLFPCFSERS